MNFYQNRTIFERHMAILVGEIAKKCHISGTNDPIWLKIKRRQYFQVSLRPQEMKLCCKFKGIRDFGSLKHLEKSCIQMGCGDIHSVSLIRVQVTRARPEIFWKSRELEP